MKISVVTITFNSEKTLRDTIKSVLAQSHKDLEYIVVDGASRDSTMDIVKEFAPLFGDRIKYVSEPDKGIYDAMNKGIQMASGVIVGTLNSDDVFASDDVLEIVAKAFENPLIDCVFGKLDLVDSQNLKKILRVSNCGEYKTGAFKKGWHPAHPTFYTYKKFFEKFGYYKTDFKISADFELMMRFIEKNKLKSLFLNKLMVNQRVGGASTTFAGHIKGNLEILKAFKVNGIRPPLLCIPQKVLPKFFNIIKKKF